MKRGRNEKLYVNPKGIFSLSENIIKKAKLFFCRPRFYRARINFSSFYVDFRLFISRERRHRIERVVIKKGEMFIMFDVRRSQG